jgi:hypothetical protein
MPLTALVGFSTDDGRSHRKLFPPPPHDNVLLKMGAPPKHIKDEKLKTQYLSITLDDVNNLLYYY